jgi:hypothetical protein
MGLALVAGAESAIKAAIKSGTVKTVDHALVSAAVPWPARRVAASQGSAGTVALRDSVHTSHNFQGPRAWEKMVRG